MWLFYMEFVLLALNFVVQITAIALLYQRRNNKRNKHQTYIISSLCITEQNGTLVTVIMLIAYRKASPLINHMIWFYFHWFVRLAYHSNLTLSTIDSFLVFHLNMKYLIVWSPERLLKSLKVVLFISLLTYFSIACLFFIKPIDWYYVSNVMFIAYFIWDIIYIVQVIATYIYIFIKYKKHRELLKRLKTQSNTRQQLLLIPSLLMVTLIIFFCMPDFVTVIFQLGNVISNGLELILAKAYKISWLADPIIFICNCKLLKKQTLTQNLKVSRQMMIEQVTFEDYRSTSWVI